MYNFLKNKITVFFLVGLLSTPFKVIFNIIPYQSSSFIVIIISTLLFILVDCIYDNKDIPRISVVFISLSIALFVGIYLSPLLSVFIIIIISDDILTLFDFFKLKVTESNGHSVNVDNTATLFQDSININENNDNNNNNSNSNTVGQLSSLKSERDNLSKNISVRLGDLKKLDDLGEEGYKVRSMQEGRPFKNFFGEREALIVSLVNLNNKKLAVSLSIDRLNYNSASSSWHNSSYNTYKVKEHYKDLLSKK